MTTTSIPRGINEHVVKEISKLKNEPKWMRDFRLEALKIFEQLPMPKWGPDLSAIDFGQLQCYAGRKGTARSWNDVPSHIKAAYSKLGVPQAERESLAGVNAQYNSSTAYSKLKKKWQDQGVIFTDTDSAIQDYPDLIRHFLGTVIRPNDNKFAALNSAVWSGGTFVYVPKGVSVDIPFQSCFYIGRSGFGQFERTLIIADEGSYVNCIEACVAPTLAHPSLHAAVFEVVVKPNARVRCTAIQNWSDSIYNLVTKRMLVEQNGIAEWISGNIGSKVIMAYPSVVLAGPGAKGDILSMTIAGKNNHKDTGGKAIHLASNTSSTLVSKSICLDGGRSTYHGLIKASSGVKGVRSFSQCDALLLDEQSRCDTYPVVEVDTPGTAISHEANVGRISQDQLFYLTSRGISRSQATALIINGFIEPIVRELPLTYASELNRLIALNMEGGVG